jgi:hypothetical protein
MILITNSILDTVECNFSIHQIEETLLIDPVPILRKTLFGEQ